MVLNFINFYVWQATSLASDVAGEMDLSYKFTFR